MGFLMLAGRLKSRGCVPLLVKQNILLLSQLAHILANASILELSSDVPNAKENHTLLLFKSIMKSVPTHSPSGCRQCQNPEITQGLQGKKASVKTFDC
eukprot:1147189-Pelagomonas_calceolata.AAC.1